MVVRRQIGMTVGDVMALSPFQDCSMRDLHP